MEYRAATPEQLGQILIGYRKQKGLTQRELGARVGLAQNTVSVIESDPGRTSVTRLFRLLSALELDLLLTDRSNPKEALAQEDW